MNEFTWFAFEPENLAGYSDNARKYNLQLPITRNWKSATNRLLVVFQTIAGIDIHEQSLCGDKVETATPVANAIQYAIKLASRYDKEHIENVAGDLAIAHINHNGFRHMHLPPDRRAETDRIFAQRIRQAIARLKPTMILVSGDEAMHALMPEVRHPQYKRGWVHMFDNIPLVSTVDFFRITDNNKGNSNLLGFWCRHLVNLLLGENPHDLSNVKAVPKFIRTIQQFDTVMRYFDEANEVAIDTETRNLSVLKNAIYTIQFAFDRDPTIGYVLAIDHPMAHWTDAERQHIKRELRKRFSARTGPLLITFNGMFDLRILRKAFDIPFMWLRVWEITFGEHGLDENYTALNTYCSMRDVQMQAPSRFGGLRPIYVSYGNDHYLLDGVFGKQDRDTSGTVSPYDPGFMLYAATDVVSIIHIKAMQQERAYYAPPVDGKNFKAVFTRHMLYQMSDTAHVLSLMEQDGSLVDKPYLRSLLLADSPLRIALNEALKELAVHREVKQANASLLRNTGFKTGSLFDKPKENWMFSFNKPEHRKVLFFDVLKLKPVSQTEKGEDAIDNKFIDTYKNTNKVVALYNDYKEEAKLLSTYVKGWYKLLTTRIDEVTDSCLRSSYRLVDTGRLGSFSPNLQNIPARGKKAKIIKQMFPVPPGYLSIRFDESAHEIRVWSLVSNDEALASSFRTGQTLRKAFIRNPSDENRKKLAEEGDLHIINVKKFFGKLVSKSDPLRAAIKGVVFGLIYGKTPSSLGEDTKKADLDALKDKLGKLYDRKLEIQKLLSYNSED